MSTPLERLEARATRSPLWWAKRWTPEAVPAPYAPHHAELVTLPEPGHSQLRSVWRGSAKSTLTLALIAWLCERKKAKGILLVRSTGSDCKADREHLERTCRLRGMPYRMDGEERMITINGVPVWTRTPGGAVRGLKYMTDAGEVIRPDLLVVDDLETRETARSVEQTNKIQTWLLADAMQCGGQGNPIRTIVLGTPITPTCLVAKMMRREEPFAGWDEPLVVPIVDSAGLPAWPGLNDPTLKPIADGGRVDSITWATEYMLQPLPEGTLIFPPAGTGWVLSPRYPQVVIAIDPSAGGQDSTGMVAMCVTPRGLHVYDAYKWDGPHTGLVDAVVRFVARVRERGATVVQVAVEAVGAWKFAADAIAVAVAPILTTCETPTDSKTDRALKLSRWQQAGAFTADPELRGSPWDVELHSFTQEGLTVTGHDDMTDATGWAGAVLTGAWSVHPPPKVTALAS